MPLSDITMNINTITVHDLLALCNRTNLISTGAESVFSALTADC
jgi:hypothetical protein